MTANGFAVSLADVSLVHDGGAVALRHVSFTVPAGQFCAILGPSGAGKSTLLRVIGGMIAPDSGSVRLNGQDVSLPLPRDLARHIGQVHQDFALVAQASAAENIVAGASAVMPAWRVLSGAYPRWARERAVALHLALGLEPAQLSVPAGLLSGGQQQRLGIARGLMMEPALVLADEPVASVDPATARQVLGVLADWRDRSGATVLCTLHQPELACAFAERILVLDAGNLVFDGTPSEYRAAILAAEAA